MTTLMCNWKECVLSMKTMPTKHIIKMKPT